MLLAPLLVNICELGDFEFDGMIIKYYSVLDEALVFVGKYPIPEDSYVDKSDIEVGKPLQIVVTQPKSSANATGKQSMMKEPMQKKARKAIEKQEEDKITEALLDDLKKELPVTES